MVTSGTSGTGWSAAGGDVGVPDGEGLSSPPLPPPMRPSSFGGAVVVPSVVGRCPCRGSTGGARWTYRPRRASPGRSAGAGWPSPRSPARCWAYCAGPRCRPCPSRGRGEHRLERLDLFVYGVEDVRDLVADVRELDGEPVAEAVPGVPVGLGEGVEPGHRGEGAVPLVRLAEQPVALGGVVLHPAQDPADLGERLVVEVARAAALHEAARLAEAGGGLVEVDAAAVRVVVRHAQLDVLHPALQPVERVTGKGVGAGGGHSAEGSRGHADREAAGGEALGPAGPGRSFRSGEARWAPCRWTSAAPGRWGPRRRSLHEHRFHGGDHPGPMHHFDLGIELRLGQLAESVR